MGNTFENAKELVAKNSQFMSEGCIDILEKVEIWKYGGVGLNGGCFRVSGCNGVIVKKRAYE